VGTDAASCECGWGSIPTCTQKGMLLVSMLPYALLVFMLVGHGKHADR
jgi:hypothetical protein